MIQRGRWPEIRTSAARRAADRPTPPIATATILPACSPSITGTAIDWYFQTFFKPLIRSSTSIGRAATMPTSAGTGAGATPRSSFLPVRLSPVERSCIVRAAALAQDSCHLIILSVSPRRLLTPTAADIS